MKPVSLLFAILLVSGATQAQFRHPQDQQTAAILNRQASASHGQAKASAANKHLAGHSQTGHGVLTDSSRHVYYRDVAQSFPTLLSYFNNSLYQAPFDASDPLSVQYIKSDTSWTYTSNGSGLHLLNLRASQYDGAGNLTRNVAVDSDGSKKSYEHVITSNSQGQRLTVQRRDTVGTGGTVTDKLKSYFLYDASGRIVQDSGVQNNLYVYRQSYSYGTNGKLALMLIEYFNGTVWTGYTKWEYSYDGSNRLMKSVLSRYVSGNWVNNAKDSFGYTGTSAQVTYEEQARWDIPSATWQYTYGCFKDYRQLDANDRIVGQLELYNAGFGLDTASRTTYTYSADGFLDHADDAAFNKASNSFDPASVIVRFYYETFTSAGLGNQPYKTSTMAVYPNPAATTLTIAGRANPSYSIKNLTGQTVVSGTTVNGIIDISKLMAGTYIISLQDKATGDRQSQSFVKQ